MCNHNFLFQHTERVYQNYTRLETNRENGYWLITMDYNSPTSVKEYVPEIANAQIVPDCDDRLYCGLPYLMPALSIVS